MICFININKQHIYSKAKSLNSQHWVEFVNDQVSLTWSKYLSCQKGKMLVWSSPIMLSFHYWSCQLKGTTEGMLLTNLISTGILWIHSFEKQKEKSCMKTQFVPLCWPFKIPTLIPKNTTCNTLTNCSWHIGKPNIKGLILLFKMA